GNFYRQRMVVLTSGRGGDCPASHACQREQRNGESRDVRSWQSELEKSVPLPVQGEHRDFGSNAEAESPAVADTLVDVHRGAAVVIETRGEPAGLLADEESADARPVHLAAVGVPAQHQVAALLADMLDGERVVSQDQSRGPRAQVAEGGLQ